MGIVYLIEPCELKDTKRYKVGCSSKDDMSRIVKGYKNGTIVHVIYHTEKFNELEKILLTKFGERFQLIAGREYFEGDIHDMKQVFMEEIYVHLLQFKTVHELWRNMQIVRFIAFLCMCYIVLTVCEIDKHIQT